jgi:DNA (cytosine-5)-methyltransferase 1
VNELALFAGAGGGILGGHLLGWRTVCAVERDAYAAGILAQRQNDRLLPTFPIWSDVSTFDGRPWRGIVDVVSGGFPCQDISAAGKGAGIEGARSGLWTEMFRIVCDVRPRFVFVENSPMLTLRGLGKVLGDLASVGFAAEWCVLGACHIGGDCIGERLWILAAASGERRPEVLRERANRSVKKSGWASDNDDTPGNRIERIELRFSEPAIHGSSDGLAHRVDRLRAIGNGQVPSVAATAFRLLQSRILT